MTDSTLAALYTDALRDAEACGDRRISRALRRIITAVQHYTQDRYDDMTFPLIGEKVDETSGRLSFNFAQGTVEFASNARYPEEPVALFRQTKHSWKPGTVGMPHLHWLQKSADVPNWLLQVVTLRNGVAPDLASFYVPQTHVFTYTSGSLNQITVFPQLNFSALKESDMVYCRLYRDTANASLEFAGADPLAGAASAYEFDIHMLYEKPGTVNEYPD